MWVMLSRSFLSIVQPPEGERGGKRDLLLVRARVAGDIERVFPSARVSRTPDRDYLFRAFIPRPVVAKAMAAVVERLDYGNVKASVTEDDRHDAYAECWGAMFRLQQARARGGRRLRRPAAPRLPWYDDKADEVPA